MKTLKNLFILMSIAFGLALVLAQPTIAGSGYGKPADKADIVDTAIQAGSFSTLVTAVKEAGLVETLKGDGPFTVFAPTDEAFAKIPKEQLEALLADKEALTAVLTYHVVPGAVTSDQLAGQRLEVGALEGLELLQQLATLLQQRLVKRDLLVGEPRQRLVAERTEDQVHFLGAPPPRADLEPFHPRVHGLRGLPARPPRAAASRSPRPARPTGAAGP